MKATRPVLAPPRTLPVGQMRRNLEAVQRFRLQVVAGALLVLFAGLLGRLAKLQLVDAAAYSRAAAHRHHRQHAFTGMRGRILDARGRTLVTSRRVLEVAVDPQDVEDPGHLARLLGVLLDADDVPVRVRRILAEAPPGCRHRVLLAGVEDERVVAQLTPYVDDYAATVRAGLRGLKVTEQERRTYPNGHYAAHVLGRPPREEGGELSGGAGVEGTFHDALKGDRILVSVERDGGRQRRCRAALAIDTSGTIGHDLTLTLDVVVQHYVETALDHLDATWRPECAAAVVLDPRTAHVLALASRPTFHPARASGGFNYAVQGRFPPGSIFKPFTVAYALGLGVVGPEERIDLEPRQVFSWRGARRAVSDSHPTAEADGRGTVVRLLSRSSNPGAARLLWAAMGEGRGPGEESLDAVHDLLARLDLDQPVAFELPGGKPARYGREKRLWNPLHPAVGFAFGQGFAISPLHLISCFAAFARDDARIVTPTLRPGHGGPRLDLPPVCRTRADLERIRDGLRACVEEGTAARAFRDCPVPVAGKTGTAQLPGTSFDVAGFIGYAPAERPRILVLVMAQVDERRVHPTAGVEPFGGNVAAPAVRSVMEQTLAYLDGRVGEAPCEGEQR